MSTELTDAQVWDQEIIARETGEPTDVTAEPAATEVSDTEPAEPIIELVEEPTPDPVLAALEKLSNRMRNVEGHIGGLTSQQQAIRDSLTVSKEAATQVSAAPSQAAVQEALKNPELWDALKDDYPEWAAATEALLDAREQRLLASLPKHEQTAESLQALIDERVKGETGAIRQEIITTSLEAIYPGWQDDVNTDAFGHWLTAQPQDIQALAQSAKVGDAAKMLSLWTQRNTRSPIQDKRTQTLEAAAAAPGKGSGKAPQPKSPEEMTPEELWEHEVNLRAKRHR